MKNKTQIVKNNAGNTENTSESVKLGKILGAYTVCGRDKQSIQPAVQSFVVGDTRIDCVSAQLTSSMGKGRIAMVEIAEPHRVLKIGKLGVVDKIRDQSKIQTAKVKVPSLVLQFDTDESAMKFAKTVNRKSYGITLIGKRGRGGIGKTF